MRRHIGSRGEKCYKHAEKTPKQKPYRFWVPRRLFFFTLTRMVRLGMQVAFASPPQNFTCLGRSIGEVGNLASEKEGAQ